MHLCTLLTPGGAFNVPIATRPTFNFNSQAGTNLCTFVSASSTGENSGPRWIAKKNPFWKT